MHFVDWRYSPIGANLVMLISTRRSTHFAAFMRQPTVSILTESKETAVQSGRGRGGRSFSPSSARVVRGLRNGVSNMKPCVGDWVEVRSKEEILRTLDKSGRLEGLPFMPQMFQYC